MTYEYYKIKSLTDFNNSVEQPKTGVVFGSFSMPHIGHSKVISKLLEESKKENLNPVLISIVLNNENILSTEEEKIFQLKQTDLHSFITYDLTELNLAPNSLKTNDFLKNFTELIIRNHNTSLIISGKTENYTAINEVAHSFNVKTISCDLVEANNNVINTDYLYQLLISCKFDEIKKYCITPYTFIGIVEHGKGLGKTVGMPTANLKVPSGKIKPREGVYKSNCIIKGKSYKGLTNIGTRPSVDNDLKITIETFILDFDEDIYDEKIVVELDFFIRGVQKFPNLEAVKKQVEKDIEVVLNSNKSLS